MTAVLDYETTTVPQDISPILTPEGNSDLTCEVCGKSLTYSGRGRKPKRCDEHKKGGTPSGKTRGNSASNQRLADQATDALMQLNGLVAMGLMLAHMPATASAMGTAQDGFREQANAALLTDPDLCRTILRAGTTSGRVSLLIAYGMLGATVAPVGIAEFRENRESRSADRSASDGTT